MTKEKIIQYWIESSEENYKSMLNLFKAGEYMWALFIGHLVIEKLLKAIYVKKVNKEVPLIHNLYKLALKSKLGLTADQKEALQYITLFNIEVRYEDYKKEFYEKCSREFADKNIEKIKELREWLKEKIND